MSRLSGFSAKYKDQEIFSVTWKNYLELDAVIWGQSFDNHAVEDRSIDDDDIILIFNSPADFETVVIALEMRIAQGFTGDEIMMHTKEEAEQQWMVILRKIHDFLTLLATDTFDIPPEIEFFSCN